MSWTTPKTWTGVLVTVADLNTHIRDNLNYLKQKMMALTMFTAYGGQLISNPGTTYVRPAQFDRAQSKVDFSQLESYQVRAVVTATASEAGSGKGIAIYTTGGTKLCEATWNGSSQQDALAGSWTTITQNADTVIEVRLKGSSATEDITVHSVALQLKG